MMERITQEERRDMHIDICTKYERKRAERKGGEGDGGVVRSWKGKGKKAVPAPHA